MKFDAQQIEQIFDTMLAKNKRILNIESDVATLKGDVAILKGDVATLKGDVVILKDDVATLKGDVATLKGDVHHQGLLHESMQHDIKLILDAVLTLRKDSEEVAKIVATQTRHEDRLSALESGFKHHVKDTLAHS